METYPLLGKCCWRVLGAAQSAGKPHGLSRIIASFLRVFVNADDSLSCTVDRPVSTFSTLLGVAAKKSPTPNPIRWFKSVAN